jgi:hypothetical protein
MNHMPFSGNWISRFASPSGNIHNFKLAVESDNSTPAAHLTMRQIKSGDLKPSLFVNYVTQASVTGRFMGLLSTDSAGLGLNCMVLQLSENADSLSGLIAWNSLTAGCVQQGEIEFKRAPISASENSD